MRKSRPRLARIIVPVVSMGDIAFLLIIFFMLCSNFAKDAGQQVTPARSPDIDRLARASIFVNVDNGQEIYVQGSRVSGPEEVEALLSQLITEQTPEPMRRVQLKIDAAVGPGVYKPLIEAIARTGGAVEFVGQKDWPRE